MKKLFTLFAAALFATNISAQEIVFVPAIQNGDLEGDDNSSFYSKEANSDPYNSEIEDGIGKDGSRGIKVATSAGDDLDWSSQFWIAFDEPIAAGSKIRGSFDVKADVPVTIGTQAHAEPSDYIHWQAIGDVPFTEEWTTYTFEITVNSSMAPEGRDFRSIAFNLSPQINGARVDNVFYFDNFVIEKGVVPAPQWMNILPNGDCEGDLESGIVEADGENGTLYSFLSREITSGEQTNQPIIADGVGVEESRGTMLTSSEDAATDWDTQFFITTGHKFEVDERFRVTFDYRADVEDLGLESVSIGGPQAHAAPGAYIDWNTGIAGLNFTQDWQSFDSGTVIVSSSMTKPDDDNFFQSLAYNMNPQIDGARQEVTYYFDNIKFFIDRAIATWDDELMNEKTLLGVKTLKSTDNTTKAQFNLAGQRVDKNYKGIVIENGQKRINK